MWHVTDVADSETGVDTSSRIALTPPSRQVNRTAPPSVVVVSASHGRVPTTAPLARSQEPRPATV